MQFAQVKLVYHKLVNLTKLNKLTRCELIKGVYNSVSLFRVFIIQCEFVQGVYNSV